MRFFTYDLAIHIATGLVKPLDAIRRHNANLARHGSEALESVALNVAEASGRLGGDRHKQFSVALGSLRELNAAIDLAVLRGYLADAPLAIERDRLGGLLWSLAHRKRR